MVFGMGKKKKSSANKGKGSTRSLNRSKPTLRSHEGERCRDSARSTRGARSNVHGNQRRGIMESVSSSARSLGGRRGSQKSSFRHDVLPASSSRNNGDSAAIRVTVRFRPLSRKEKAKGDLAVWGVDENKNVGCYHKGCFSPKYHYDTVFTDDQDNQYVYASVGTEIVETAMNGVNGTIFAYGVTSSGKTHTMMGDNGEMGMVPRAIQHVFDQIEQNPDKEYLLRLSMLELYNEELNDLIDPSRRNLKVREDRTKGVHVDGLTEVVLESTEQALCLINDGIQNRQVSATTFNEGSSRSHTVCRVSIEIHDRSSGKGSRMRSYLNLIDLAGSESARAAKSKGHRMEGSYINKSLLTLGTVIHKLSESKKKSHIPFRDSKLTRLLQSSLTGSGSKMAIVCCVTPSSSQAEETENTLKFAERAKKVKIKRSKNEVMDSKSEIARLHSLIADLKHQLKDLTEKATVPAPDPALQEELAKVRERLEEELHARMKREEDRLELEAKIRNLKRLILHSTRAQTGNMVGPRLQRSHSFDALKAKSAVNCMSKRSLPGVVIHPDVVPTLSPEVSEAKSFSWEANASLNPVNVISATHERRTSISTPLIRSPSSNKVDLPGIPSDHEFQSENEFLRSQLNIVRQTVAERERELSIRERESMELRRRLASYENSNPSTSRSHASDDETQTFEYSVLEADRGILEQSLIGARKEKERLTNELLRTKIELKRTKKKLHEFEGARTEIEHVFGGAVTEVPMSPTGSVSTTGTGHSDTFIIVGRNPDDRSRRQPQHQMIIPAAMHEQMVVSPTELRMKLAKLEAEVRCALEALSIKDNQIESQKREIVSQKEEAEEVRQLLHNLGSENEGLKQRIKMLEAQQHRMQGYLLDTMPTTDLYQLRADIKDASHRLERAAYSRRISSIPAMSFDELDVDSQDIYVSKGLESIED